MVSKKKIIIIGILSALIVFCFLVVAVYPKEYIETVYFHFGASRGNYRDGFLVAITEEILITNVGPMGWKIDFYVYGHNMWNNVLVKVPVLCGIARDYETIWTASRNLESFVVGTTLYASGEFTFSITTIDPDVSVRISVQEWKNPLLFKLGSLFQDDQARRGSLAPGMGEFG